MTRVLKSKLRLVERDEAFSAQLQQIAREMRLEIGNSTEVLSGDKVAMEPLFARTPTIRILSL